jgi:hypothetical protein
MANCIFCSSEAREEVRPDARVFFCPICGTYEISGTALSMFNARRQSQPPLEPALLSPEVRRLPRTNDQPAFISSDTIRDLMDGVKVPPVRDQFNNTILYLGDKLEAVNPAGVVHHKSAEWAAVVGGQDGFYIVKALEGRGLVHATYYIGGFRAGLTPEGWDEYERLKAERQPAPQPSPPLTAPASDRIVPLDHNSPEYVQVTETLDRLTEAVRGSNEYQERDPDDKDQRLGELEASKTLLKSRRVRLAALAPLLLGALYWLAEQFAGSVIGELSSELIEYLKLMLGL